MNPFIPEAIEDCLQQLSHQQPLYDAIFAPKSVPLRVCRACGHPCRPKSREGVCEGLSHVCDDCLRESAAHETKTNLIGL